MSEPQPCDPSKCQSHGGMETTLGEINTVVTALDKSLSSFIARHEGQETQFALYAAKVQANCEAVNKLNQSVSVNTSHVKRLETDLNRLSARRDKREDLQRAENELASEQIREQFRNVWRTIYVGAISALLLYGASLWAIFTHFDKIIK